MGSRMDKKLIIFDMDGTLIDSAPSLAYAINLMLKDLNKEPLSVNRVREFIGQGSEILVKRALVNDVNYQNYNIDEDYFKKAHQIFLKHYSNNLNSKTTLFKNAKETLEFLKDKYKLALVTNKPQQFVKDILQHFEIDKYFDYILGANENIAKKPAPDMLIKTLNDLNIEPKEAIMVGDSANDITAAKSANIDTIAVTYGYYSGDIKELEPTFVIDDLKDIKEVLND